MVSSPFTTQKDEFCTYTFKQAWQSSTLSTDKNYFEAKDVQIKREASDLTICFFETHHTAEKLVKLEKFHV